MDNRALLGQICRESLLEQFERELEQSQESAKCSKRHYQRMSKIIGVRVGPLNKKTIRLILLAVAAALILSACAGYIFRDKLKGLLVEYYDDHLLIRSSADGENAPDTGRPDASTSENRDDMNDLIEAESLLLDRIYVPTYIPEGYELIETDVFVGAITYIWENQAGEKIKYAQKLSIQAFYIDNEKSETEIKYMDFDIEVFYAKTRAEYYYVWYDGAYYNKLASDVAFSEEELGRFIQGIT